MSLANELAMPSYVRSLKQWDQKLKRDFYQSIVSEMNKLLAHPDQLQKAVRQNPKFSQQSRQLFKQDFAQVDQNLLRRVKVKLQNGQHVVSIPDAKNLVFNLATMPKGYITMNGYKFSMEGFDDYRKMRRFINRRYADKKTSSFHFIIPAAYADALTIAYIVGYVLVVAAAIFGIVLDRRASKRSLIYKYEEYLSRAIRECELEQRALASSTIVISESGFSNNTLVFMQEVEKFVRKQKAGRFPVLQGIPKDHKLVVSLQQCLDEMKRFIKSRGITINNQGRYQDLQYSAYDELGEVFAGKIIE